MFIKKQVIVSLLFIFFQLETAAQQWVITKVETKVTQEELTPPLLGAYFTLTPTKVSISYPTMACSEYSSQVDDRIIYLDNEPKYFIEFRTRGTMVLTDYNRYPNDKKLERSLSRFYLEDLGNYLQKTFQERKLKTESGGAVLTDRFFHPLVSPGRIDSAVTQRMPPIVKHGAASGYILFQKDSVPKVNVLRTTGRFNSTDAENLRRAMSAVANRFETKQLPGKAHKQLFYAETQGGVFIYPLDIQWYTVEDQEQIMTKHQLELRKSDLKEMYNQDNFTGVIKEATSLLKIDSSDLDVYYLRGISLMMAGNTAQGCSELANLAKSGHPDASENFSRYCIGYSPKKITVVGRVVDAETKKPIKQAKIYNELSIVDLETNTLGYFQMSLDSGSQIIITHADYDSASLTVGSKKNFQVPMTRIPVFDNREVIFNQVDKSAYLQGGAEALAKFISSNMSPPRNLERFGYRGRVDLNLLVAESGLIDSVVVVKTTHQLHTLEALRLMHVLHRVEPALKNGVRVRSWTSLSINFPVWGGLVRERKIKDEALAEDYLFAAAAYSSISYTEALAILERALTLDPLLAKARYFRGAIYYEMGKRSVAVEDWEHALRMDIKGSIFVRNAVKEFSQK